MLKVTAQDFHVAICEIGEPGKKWTILGNSYYADKISNETHNVLMIGADFIKLQPKERDSVCIVPFWAISSLHIW